MIEDFYKQSLWLKNHNFSNVSVQVIHTQGSVCMYMNRCCVSMSVVTILWNNIYQHLQKWKSKITVNEKIYSSTQDIAENYETNS